MNIIDTHACVGDGVYTRQDASDLLRDMDRPSGHDKRYGPRESQRRTYIAYSRRELL
jgi:hypothetical protein